MHRRWATTSRSAAESVGVVAVAAVGVEVAAGQAGVVAGQVASAARVQVANAEAGMPAAVVAMAAVRPAAKAVSWWRMWWRSTG